MCIHDIVSLMCVTIHDTVDCAKIKVLSYFTAQISLDLFLIYEYNCYDVFIVCNCAHPVFSSKTGKMIYRN